MMQWTLQKQSIRGRNLVAAGFDVEVFFEENYNELLKLTLKISKNRNAARDILHYTAVILLRKKEMLRDIEDPVAFIAACLRRATFTYYKKEAKYKNNEPLEKHYDITDSSVANAYNYLEWTMLLDDALTDFPMDLRNAFKMHYLDDIPIEDLAKSLDTTPNALSKRFATMRRTIARKNPSLLRQLEVLALL